MHSIKTYAAQRNTFIAITDAGTFDTRSAGWVDAREVETFAQECANARQRPREQRDRVWLALMDVHARVSAGDLKLTPKAAKVWGKFDSAFQAARAERRAESQARTQTPAPVRAPQPAPACRDCGEPFVAGRECACMRAITPAPVCEPVCEPVTESVAEIELSDYALARLDERAEAQADMDAHVDAIVDRIMRAA